MKQKFCIFLLAASLLTGCTAPQERPAESAGSDSTAEQQSNDRGGMRSFADYLLRHDADESVADSQQDPQQQPVFTTTDTEQFLAEIAQTYTLTVDGTGLVSRSAGEYDDNLTWVIEVNGRNMLERNAVNEMTYRPMDYGRGVYRVWLEAWVSGYQIVSNTVEFTVPLPQNDTEPENEPEGFESWRITDEKGHLKHLVRRIGSVEYKLGFVIDPDHDGCCNGIAFYAGTDEAGNPRQYIFENTNDLLRFDSEQLTNDRGKACQLGIWCDPETETDYIVCITDDGSAFDCFTNEPLTDFDPEKAPYFYTFTEHSTYDCDHFYVSYQGVPAWENA